VHDLTVNKNLKLKLTCTQKLQSFHKAKQYHGSPLKASKFATVTSSSTSGTRTVFDPRPDSKPTPQSYQAFVQNMTINFKANHSRVNTTHTVLPPPPANVYALEADHDYCTQQSSDIFLSDIGVTSISEELAADIELKTRGQHENAKWLTERCVRLHSSSYKHICKAQDKGKLAKELTHYRKVDAAALRHGRQYEDTAIREFEKLTGLAVERSGIIVSPERPYMACSPDGIVSDDFILEVKCPFSARYSKITPETVTYLKLDDQTGRLALSCDHEYYYQVQGQLYVTGRRAWCFAVCTFHDFVVVDVPKNDDFITQITSQLDDFLC